ncbi:hypothetical protein [Sphingomonas sp. NPDC079357]|uniref:hypothetical protein n=1 Tax=Sphingomonas sp. NPDC079357 TaxID=3364518 RepID=UPI00384BC048
MRVDRTEQFAASGVPLVFDRFGLIGPFVADVIDPLSTARGIVTGMTMALLLWTIIAALLI